jgi:hypothetical protein
MYVASFHPCTLLARFDPRFATWCIVSFTMYRSTSRWCQSRMMILTHALRSKLRNTMYRFNHEMYRSTLRDDVNLTTHLYRIVEAYVSLKHTYRWSRACSVVACSVVCVACCIVVASRSFHQCSLLTSLSTHASIVAWSTPKNKKNLADNVKPYKIKPYTKWNHSQNKTIQRYKHWND